MNVLYIFGSEADLKKSTFIQREITELEKTGIKLSFLIINPFFNRYKYSRTFNIYTAGINPLRWLLNPFINLFFYKKSILLTKYRSTILKSFDKGSIHTIKIFGATLFLESAVTKILRSRVRIDHIHSHHLFSATLFTPCVAGIISANYSITIHTLSHYLNQAYLKQTLQNAMFLRTITNETFSYFSSNNFNNNIHLIPNCVDLTSFPKKTENTPKDILRILAIGKFLDKKGFDILIKSCKLINDRGIKFVCKIIGEGPEKKLLQKLILDYRLKNKIELIPFLEFQQILPYFQESSVLVVPSRDPKRSTRDGLPTVILEAMAIGVPVIASDFAGISDAIVHESTGLLVVPESEIALAEAILRLHKNPDLASNLIKNSITRIEDNFSLKKNISHLAELFNHS